MRDERRGAAEGLEWGRWPAGEENAWLGVVGKPEGYGKSPRHGEDDLLMGWLSDRVKGFFPLAAPPRPSLFLI